ncbi:aldo/keto reductase [Brachybacterium squillarum]|uniref:aldo/keto reductase n=1 Tax=Brachybacterium squillarum TaxID=661979 RepID=UPI000262971C|nr:aldo/keto reductase [Brachybacterium squillarum]
MSRTVRIPRTELEVLPLNLGGNTFGWTSDRETSFAVLDDFLAAGGTFVDTADGYSAWAPGNSGGESEATIGEWMAERGVRDRMVIATKVSTKPDRQGLSAENVEAALTESLQRLRTDHVDLYYFHFDDENVAIADQVRTAHELVASGRVRHMALSNYSPARMREWLETARELDLTLPVAIQPQYNLLHRAEVEQDYAPLAREFDLAVFPYFALASGLLTGKYRSREDLAGTAREGMTADRFGDEALAVIDALDVVANAHGSEPTSVALAWLLAKGVTAPIASASRPAQLPALLAATELDLTEDEVALLDGASAPFA